MASEGHLFIIDGDIKKLACDAWMLPTDPSFKITDAFCDALGFSSARRIPGFGPEKWRGRGCILHRAAQSSSEPDLWLGDVGRYEDTPVSHYVDRANEFVEKAAERAWKRLAGAGRRPLVALNALGTGHGGKRQLRGQILEALIPALMRAARVHKCDIVLVTWGPVVYSAAQSVRLSLEKKGRNPWRALPEQYLELGSELAERAEQGELVLFMGAGVSRNAEIPMWRDLLRHLARRLGNTDEWVAAIENLDPRDQASLLRKANPKKFDAAVDDVMRRERYSLMHGLLASLPIKENVTTNFDDLFETAASTAGRRISVIPSTKEAPGARWLLKLHGTIGDGTNRVFTRDEYLNSISAHGALRGLVQAMLLTRYMLFVGYSLSDEDFHQLMHDVRSSLPKRSKRRLGLVLTPSPPEPGEGLWPELDFQSFADGSGTRRLAVDEAARLMTIFLDYVGSRATSDVRFVADGSLSELRTKDELELARIVESLERLLERAPADGWAAIRTFVAHFRQEAEA